MPTPVLPDPSFRLNTSLTGGQQSPAVAGLSDGRFVAVWEDANGTFGVLKYAMFNADGSVAKSEAIANVNTSGSIARGDLAIAALTGGGFAITWASRLQSGLTFQWDVFHRLFNSAGTPVTGDLPSNSSQGAGSGDQLRPDMVGDGAGGFYVVWQDGLNGVNAPSVQLRHFDAAGQPTAAATGLSGLIGGDLVPQIAVSRDGLQYTVVWDDDLGVTQGGNEDGIYGIVSGGAPFFRVDSGTNYEANGSPDVAYSTGNNFMVVWSQFLPLPSGHYEVEGRINSGPQFSVSTSTQAFATSTPKVVGLESGNFLVVWNDHLLSGGYNVLGQLLDVNGAKIGSEFTVTEFVANSIERIEASELMDGRVLVTWDVNKGPQTVGVDVFSRIVDPRQVASDWHGTSASEQYVGTGFADVLNGAGGDDRIWGKAGADQMTGGPGNDIFYVDNAGDKTFEAGGQGTDQVLTSVSYLLPAVQEIERLGTTSLAGTAAINLTGNEFAQRIDGNNGANVLRGNAGNDLLFGYAGNDTMIGGLGVDTLNGGLGNDVYVLENGADHIIDTGGRDTVTSTISRSIAGYGTVENLTLVNVASALTGTGNNLANIITGNNFNNTLTGGIGNDDLRGGIGRDVLIGGIGRDTLTGGAGNDFFVFNAPLNIANRDVINGFANVAGNNDTIRLENHVMTHLGGAGPLAANAFFAGAVAHDADDRIIYNKANGALYYDSNGNHAGGATLLAVISNKPALTFHDFVVI